MTKNFCDRCGCELTYNNRAHEYMHDRADGVSYGIAIRLSVPARSSNPLDLCGECKQVLVGLWLRAAETGSATTGDAPVPAQDEPTHPPCPKCGHSTVADHHEHFGTQPGHSGVMGSGIVHPGTYLQCRRDRGGCGYGEEHEWPMPIRSRTAVAGMRASAKLASGEIIVLESLSGGKWMDERGCVYILSDDLSHVERHQH
jgi:hypothetical protein